MTQRLSADTAAVLLVDYQLGLLSLVHEHSVAGCRNMALALANTAKLFNIPIVLTAGLEQGPNGALMPELKELLPDAPCILRSGEINAWESNGVSRAVKDLGRRQLIIAGILAEVHALFPALSALEEGYEVFVVTDACGSTSAAAREAALMRLNQAGAVMVSWISIAGELQKDWRKRGAPELAQLFCEYLPGYNGIYSVFLAAADEAAKRKMHGRSAASKWTLDPIDYARPD